MKYGNLILEKKDFVLIKRYQHVNRYIEDYAHKDALDDLEDNMSKARIYSLDEMPDDVVRIYSYVTVSIGSEWKETFQLVLPYENDIANDKISVQSTLGASVIGLSKGDTIRYGLPGGMMSLRIENVKQSQKQCDVRIADEIFRQVLPKHTKNSVTLNI